MTNKHLPQYVADNGPLTASQMRQIKKLAPQNKHESVLTVPVGISRRIEKLAQEAGRTPLQVLKLVLRDGLEYTEYAVQEANAGLHKLAAGRGIPIDEVRRRRATRNTPHAA